MSDMTPPMTPLVSQKSLECEIEQELLVDPVILPSSLVKMYSLSDLTSPTEEESPEVVDPAEYVVCRSSLLAQDKKIKLNGKILRFPPEVVAKLPSSPWYVAALTAYPSQSDICLLSPTSQLETKAPDLKQQGPTQVKIEDDYPMDLEGEVEPDAKIWKCSLRRLHVMMRLIPTLALSRAPKPSLTMDERGQIVVFTGRGKSVDTSTTLYCPILNKEVDIDPQILGKEVDELIKANPELSVEFSNESRQRDMKEGILVVLDKSGSMHAKPGFEDDPEDAPPFDWSCAEAPAAAVMSETDTLLLAKFEQKLMNYPYPDDLKHIISDGRMSAREMVSSLFSFLLSTLLSSLERL